MDTGTDQMAGSSTDVSVQSGTISGSTRSPLLVNRRRQDGNPVLKYIRNVPYQWADIKGDFEFGTGTCCLYLSLKWHKLHPDYIEIRFKEVGHSHVLQILLAVVNVDQPRHILRELNMYCYRAGWIFLLAYSVEEAAEYLELLKLNETRADTVVAELSRKAADNKPPVRNLLAVDADKQQMCTAAIGLLTSIRSISSTDAQRLIGTFGSLRNIAEASVDQLALCPGLGASKVQKVYAAFRDPFLMESKN